MRARSGRVGRRGNRLWEAKGEPRDEKRELFRWDPYDSEKGAEMRWEGRGEMADGR